MKICLLGYARDLEGGVVTVTEILLRSIPNIELIPLLHCYTPKWRAAALYARAVCRFTKWALWNRRRAVVHIVVASRGDLVRSIACLLICKSLRIPTCVQYHTSMRGLLGGVGKTLRNLSRRALQLSSLHVFLSPRLAQEFGVAFSFAGNMRVVPNALSSQWLEQRLAGYASRTTDFIYVGRWGEEKGVDVLMSCIEGHVGISKTKIYSNHCVSGVSANITFHPWGKPEEIADAMRGARVLLLPSRAEAYPTVLLEALACGTPFVASDLPGCRDIAESSGGGVIVPVGNAAALGEAARRLASDAKSWREYSLRGADWVRKAAQPQAAVMSWLAVYAELGRLRVSQEI